MKSRVLLVVVIVAFTLPFVLAWALNFGPWQWRPEASRNRGELVQPPPQIVTPAVADLDGNVVAMEALAGHWGLMYAGTSPCTEHCRSRLVAMRQTWLALGKDARRVQRWYMVTDDTVPEVKLRAEHPGLRVVRPEDSGDGSLVWALEEAAAGVPDADTIFLVDPRGFVILRYDRQIEASDMLKDLKRLLKYSAVDR